MTPKEKAEDLFNKFYSSKHRPSMSKARHSHAKDTALICVDEIIKCTFVSSKILTPYSIKDKQWWEVVKSELENF